MNREAEGGRDTTATAPPPAGSPPRRTEPAYLPQLDGLRAFAVAAVLVHHFAGQQRVEAALGGISLGLAGVRLFFVLSGFLITGLLLRSRDAAETRGGRLPAAGRFYARRTLRIFPLYYAVLGVCLLLGVPEAREHVLSLATYTFNFSVGVQGWFPEKFAHFWSLCVEEQYYLFWPWVVLFVPRRGLLAATGAMTAVGPAFRGYALATEMSGIAGYTFTPASLDSLGIGSLVAILAYRLGPSLLRPMTRYALPAGLAVWAALAVLKGRDGFGMADALLYGVAQSVVFAWLVFGASLGFRGLAGRVLTCPPLVYCGRISYGIYLYHLLLPPVLAWIGERAGFVVPAEGLCLLAMGSAATLAVASASWFAFERPLNSLKSRFRDP